jgi:hypothetical protein
VARGTTQQHRSTDAFDFRDRFANNIGFHSGFQWVFAHGAVVVLVICG